MKQTTKFLHILMCMVLGLSVSMTSCKDYDDDIDGLNERVDALETTLSQLSEQFGELAYVKSVTFDEEKGILTITPSDGEAVICPIGDGNVTYTLSGKEAEGGFELTLTPSEGTAQTVVVKQEKVEAFNPALLTVKDGKVYYGETATEVTLPAVPEAPALQIVEIKNAAGAVIGYAITYGDQPTVNLMIEAGLLKSMVFEPQAYLNGVEAMKARYIKTADWDQIVSDEEPTTTGEVWSKAAADDEDEIASLEIPAKIVARYHINPSNIDLTSIKEVRFVTDNKEYVHTKAANELGAKLEKKELVKVGDEQMLQLTFSVDGDKLAGSKDEEISVVSVQAVVVDPNAEEEEAAEHVITSDYAAIFNTTITDFRLASADMEKYKGMDDHGHLWGTDNGKAEDAIKSAVFVDGVAPVTPNVITVLYDNSQKVKLEDYVVAHYTEKDYDENNVLVNCAKDKALTREELNALGLDIRFVASNYITGDNETPQNAFFDVDEKTGEITTKVYDQSGAASIGRMPLVRVELFNIANPDEVANVGWIKLLIVRGTSEGMETTLDFGSINWGCEAVTKAVTVEFMNTEIYNKLGLSKYDFHAIYGFDGTNANGDGKVEEVVDKIEDETTIVKWTISADDLQKAEDGDVFEAKAIYKATGREDVVITLKATVKHPEAAVVGEKIKEYWGNNGMDYVRLNVKVVNNNYDIDFATDLLNTFKGNKVTVEVDEAFEDFAILNYAFTFSDENKDRKVTGLSGKEYVLSVSTDGKTLSATNGGVTEEVATLTDVSGAEAYSSLVEYAETDFAKDLLNRAAHDKLGEESFYALMNVKATNNCGLEYPLVNNGEFKAYFLRPVDIEKLDKPAVLEDAKTNGSTINLMDLIKLTDWRNEEFVINSEINFYQYYEVEQIVALVNEDAYPVYTTLNGGDINKTKLEEMTGNLELTASEGDGTWPTTAEDVKTAYGTLTLKNNGNAVGAFQLNVPVKVVYKWGEVIEYVLVDVVATQGN